jgi:hypothetical protein
MLCLQGDLGASLGAHPMVLPVVAQVVVVSFFWLMWRNDDVRLDQLRRTVRALSRFGLLALVLVWAYRLSAGLIP